MSDPFNFGDWQQPSQDRSTGQGMNDAMRPSGFGSFDFPNNQPMRSFGSQQGFTDLNNNSAGFGQPDNIPSLDQPDQQNRMNPYTDNGNGFDSWTTNTSAPPPMPQQPQRPANMMDAFKTNPGAFFGQQQGGQGQPQQPGAGGNLDWSQFASNVYGERNAQRQFNELAGQLDNQRAGEALGKYGWNFVSPSYAQSGMGDANDPAAYEKVRQAAYLAGQRDPNSDYAIVNVNGQLNVLQRSRDPQQQARQYQAAAQQAQANRGYVGNYRPSYNSGYTNRAYTPPRPAVNYAPQGQQGGQGGVQQYAKPIGPQPFATLDPANLRRNPYGDTGVVQPNGSVKPLAPSIGQLNGQLYNFNPMFGPVGPVANIRGVTPQPAQPQAAPGYWQNWQGVTPNEDLYNTPKAY